VVFEDFTHRKLTLIELLGNWRFWRVGFLTWMAVRRPLTKDSEFRLICRLGIFCLRFLGLFTLLFACCICGLLFVIFILFIIGSDGCSISGWL
jgi:hypothetical protein